VLEDEDDVINDISLSTYPGPINTKKRKLEEVENDEDSDNYSDFGNSLLDLTDFTSNYYSLFIISYLTRVFFFFKKKSFISFMYIYIHIN